MAGTPYKAYLALVPKLDASASSSLKSSLGGIDTSGAGKQGGQKYSEGFKASAEAGIASLEGVFKTVAIAGGAALTALGAAAFSSYSNYEQLVGGVDTLFGESSAKLQEYAASAYEKAGMSANQYMELATSFSATLLQSLQGDTEAAVEYANTAMVDMSDNANKMGTSMELIENAYQGFAKNNYTMLDWRNRRLAA